jgi:hypothetical protein
MRDFWPSAQKKWARAAIVFVALFGLALLTGCSSTRLVDNQVSAFSNYNTEGAKSATYRFERLLSQQATSSTAPIEAMAQAALAKHGFQYAGDVPGNTMFTVQIGARTQRYETTPPFYGAVGFGYGYRAHSFMHLHVQPPLYSREVSLLIRDVANSRVVYETHARNDSPWYDSDAIFAAMFVAAMQKFPASTTGPERVNVEIPR